MMQLKQIQIKMKVTQDHKYFMLFMARVMGAAIVFILSVIYNILFAGEIKITVVDTDGIKCESVNDGLQISSSCSEVEIKGVSSSNYSTRTINIILSNIDSAKRIGRFYGVLDISRSSSSDTSSRYLIIGNTTISRINSSATFSAKVNELLNTQHLYNYANDCWDGVGVGVCNITISYEVGAVPCPATCVNKNTCSISACVAAGKTDCINSGDGLPKTLTDGTGVCGKVCSTGEGGGGAGTCDSIHDCTFEICGDGYVCTEGVKPEGKRYCRQLCPDGKNGNICTGKNDCSSNTFCGKKNACDSETFSCVKDCVLEDAQRFSCKENSDCTRGTNCPSNTVCDIETRINKHLHHGARSCVLGCPDGTPGSVCTDDNVCFNNPLCTDSGIKRLVCDLERKACMAKCPNDDPSKGECPYVSGVDTDIGGDSYHILSVSGSGAGCQATILDADSRGKNNWGGAKKICDTAGYKSRLPFVEELKKINPSDATWSSKTNVEGSASVVGPNYIVVPRDINLVAKFSCVQTIIGTGSNIGDLGTQCTDNSECNSQTTTCEERNLCFNGQCVDPVGIILPPTSGGGNIDIIINEYGFSPYPDMDYNSLMSKYPVLGRKCDITSGSSFICGNGFTCRAGIYDTEAGMDDIETRCFFNSCNNSSTDSEHCINLQKINWKDAISDNDTSSKEYLSKSNQYRNDWSGFESNQELAYKMHLLNSLPPSPAQTYKSSVYNLKQYGDCTDNSDCLEGICDIEKKKCTCTVDTDCVAGGFCDTGTGTEPYLCAMKPCVSGSNDLTNRDLVYESQDINCHFCIAADLVEQCGNYSCANDSECAFHGACNKCDTDLVAGGACVSTIPVCAVAENNWRQQVEKSVGDDLKFNEQGEVIKYKVIKDTYPNPNPYHVVYRENNNNILKELTSSLSKKIINVEARLREIKSVVKAWEQWYGFCKNPEKMNPKTVLWETDDSDWNALDSDMLNNYQEITGGNLQINCLTDDPVPPPGTVFLEQAKNLNLPGLLDQTKSEFLNSTDVNILPSRGWYDAQFIFNYYLSRCYMEKAALADVLSCFENITDTEELNYCKYCSSGLFPFSCKDEAKSYRDRFYYGKYSHPGLVNIETFTIRQKIPRYKSIDLCMNPTVLYHIVGNSTINSGSVVNVTPQSLPLVSDIDTVIIPMFCTDSESRQFVPGCIVCTDTSENSNCLTNLNCAVGYQLVIDNSSKKMCVPLPKPVSDKKTIFQYLLNWGG